MISARYVLSIASLVAVTSHLTRHGGRVEGYGNVTVQQLETVPHGREGRRGSSTQKLITPHLQSESREHTASGVRTLMTSSTVTLFFHEA